LQVQFDEINASLASFSGNVVTLNSTLGTIQTDLHTIKLEVTAINGTTATIQTVLGAVNGTVTSINNQTATILVPELGQVQADISGLKQTSVDWTVLQYVTVAVAATAAVSAVVSVVMLKRRKTASVEQDVHGPPS